ncbi:hypothetical protein NHF48_000735 [Sphingomonas sp. H160509]|uniref:hypothetical protein n=1 Tax=Sphingomonas sp. H160509 TaxID=2955313 RepID=UPI0020985091|nr:hypothetical protein [Sphingomonas sp. H160509]MDD1449784.1 hypothetical protein [Sphingomonas sp. H160509]
MSFVRVPIKGWSKCVYEAASFESNPEYCAAKLLDADSSVIWWLRNDPVRLRIPSPAGFLEPDFLYSKTINGRQVIAVLEVKGEHLWNGPGSVARIKAAGAKAWARAIAEAKVDPEWHFHEVLGQDVESSHTLASMLDKAVLSFKGM